MAEVKNNILNNNIAGDTSNILVPDTSAIKNGIEFKSNINSNVLNGYYNLLSEAIQFLQFTGGLYSEEANYDEGNIASLVIKNGEDYSIWQFRRNANNPQVLNNNPPITGASITTVNGVDAYEGGTLNTDWDKLTEDYAADAAPNTVMGRDGEGASNVNMPSSIENTTVVNNQYLQQELQSGLAAKQDKLTAGTNITIEDNVISASGDLANRMPVGSFYTQYAEDDGTFDEDKSPSNLFGGTWQILHNNEGIFLRTEGGYANENRVDGIQGDAIRNIAGTIQIMTTNLAAPTGVFDYTWGFDKLFTFTAIETQDGWRHVQL